MPSRKKNLPPLPVPVIDGTSVQLLVGAFVPQPIPWDAEKPIPDLNIFVGSEVAAADLEALRRNNITGIINCIGGCEPKKYPGIVVYHVPVEDNGDAPIGEYFRSSFEFVETILSQGGGVLIHCQQGISRAVTITIAVLMQKLGCDFEYALDKIQEVRKQANPNLGFCRILYDFKP